MGINHFLNRIPNKCYINTYTADPVFVFLCLCEMTTQNFIYDAMFGKNTDP